MVFFILIFFGLVFGSFISALTWRIYQTQFSKTRLINKDLSIIQGRSMCPKCQRQLAWYDLVPVFSWITLLGRCRYCQERISWHYPVLELSTAGLFVISYAYWPYELMSLADWALFGFWLILLVILIALFVFDLRWMYLPDNLVWPALLVALIMVSTELEMADSIQDLLLNRFWGLVVGAGFFGTIYAYSRGKWIGFGDVKLALVMGSLLGFGKAILAIMIGFYVATLLVVALMLIRKLNRKQAVPLGPFLIAGTILSFLFGQQIIDWYMDLIYI